MRSQVRTLVCDCIADGARGKGAIEEEEEEEDRHDCSGTSGLLPGVAHRCSDLASRVFKQ